MHVTKRVEILPLAGLLCRRASGCEVSTQLQARTLTVPGLLIQAHLWLWYIFGSRWRALNAYSRQCTAVLVSVL